MVDSTWKNIEFSPRVLVIFLCWCVVNFLLMYFYPLALAVIALIYFVGLMPISKRMEGVFQEILYMGMLALVICLPVGYMYANS